MSVILEADDIYHLHLLLDLIYLLCSLYLRIDSSSPCHLPRLLSISTIHFYCSSTSHPLGYPNACNIRTYMQRKESIRNQAEAAWQLTKNEKKYVSLLITLFDFIQCQCVRLTRKVHDSNHILEEEGVIVLLTYPLKVKQYLMFWL